VLSPHAVREPLLRSKFANQPDLQRSPFPGSQIILLHKAWGNVTLIYRPAEKPEQYSVDEPSQVLINDAEGKYLGIGEVAVDQAVADLVNAGTIVSTKYRPEVVGIHALRRNHRGDDRLQWRAIQAVYAPIELRSLRCIEFRIVA